MNEHTPFWIKFFAGIGIISTILFVSGLSACLIFYKTIINSPSSNIVPENISTTSTTNTPAITTPTENNNQHPYLSESQEKMIRTMGIDIETLPTSISEEQEACAIQTLGQERVNEIIAGDTPTALEILKAKKCF